MENEVFERDYQEKTTGKETVKSEKELSIIDLAVESGCFKAYSDAMKKIPKYIVQEDKEAYEDLLARLDAYAKELHGKIKGVIDYERWESYITVELPHFEACNLEEFALLSDLASKTDSVTFKASGNGGIRLHVMIGYFDEVEDTDHVLDTCLAEDDELAKILAEYPDTEKDTALSDPEIAEFLEKFGSEMGMTAEEAYDYIDELYHSAPEAFLNMLFRHTADDDENEDTEDTE